MLKSMFSPPSTIGPVVLKRKANWPSYQGRSKSVYPVSFKYFGTKKGFDCSSWAILS